MDLETWGDNFVNTKKDQGLRFTYIKIARAQIAREEKDQKDKEAANASQTRPAEKSNVVPIRKVQKDVIRIFDDYK